MSLPDRAAAEFLITRRDKVVPQAIICVCCVFEALQENETRIAHVRISLEKNWGIQFIAHYNARGMFKNIPMGAF